MHHRSNKVNARVAAQSASGEKFQPNQRADHHPLRTWLSRLACQPKDDPTCMGPSYAIINIPHDVRTASRVHINAFIRLSNQPIALFNLESWKGNQNQMSDVGKSMPCISSIYFRYFVIYTIYIALSALCLCVEGLL